MIPAETITRLYYWHCSFLELLKALSARGRDFARFLLTDVRHGSGWWALARVERLVSCVFFWVLNGAKRPKTQKNSEEPG